jgi:hypothetical protein
MQHFSSLLKGPKTLSEALEKALSEHKPTQYQVGRAVENNILLDDKTVGRYHGRLTQLTPTSFLLEDLDSKHGTWVNGTRVARKIVTPDDRIRFAETEYSLTGLLTLAQPQRQTKQNPLDFTAEFSTLKIVYEQYPVLRKNCQNRDKLIRTASVVLSSIVGVSAILTSGPVGLPLLQVLSGAGLGVLIPALSSTLLSTDEKIELLDKEYRSQYRCPNPDCQDPFGNREWAQLARQKTCPRCKAVWVN